MLILLCMRSVFGLVYLFMVVRREILLSGRAVACGLIWLFLIFPGSGHAQHTAQDSIELQFRRLDSSVLDVHLKFIRHFPTIDSCRRYLQLLPAKLVAEGYVGASVDSVWQAGPGRVNASLYIGPVYQWSAIDLAAVYLQ